MTAAAGEPFRSIPGGKASLPHSEEAEKAVVGGLLFSCGAALRKIESIIGPEHCYHPVLQAIFGAILTCDRRGVPADLVMVAEQLRETGEISKLRPYGGEAYLAELANNVATVENIAYHARIVLEHARRRQVIEIGAHISQRGYVSVDDVAAKASQRLIELSASGDWPEPAALTQTLLPVPKMTEALLPPALRPWLSDVVERAQCPLEYAAVGAIIGAGTLIGRQIAVRPRELDSWTEFPNLWGMVVGPPGVLKSPALGEALGPVYAVEKEAWRAFAKKKEEAEVKEPVRKAQEKNIALRMQKKAVADEVGQEELIKETMEELEELYRKAQAQKLVPQRFVTNDATVEKLVELLQESCPNGILIHRDEMRGLFLSWEKDGHEGDRAFFLEGWKGDGTFTTDRISRGTNRVDGMCLSLVGTIQPGPLAQYVARTVRGGDDDGLLQRFQLTVYPDVGSTYTDVDRLPNREARERAWVLYERLTKLDPAELQAQMDERGGVPYLRFDPAAAEFATAFREDCVRRSLSPTELPSVRAHLSKYRKLHPSLALNFHLLACADVGWGGPIPLETAQLAADWCRLLEAHARRVYWLGLCQEETPTNLLASRIRAGELGDRFRVRDVYNKHWAGLLDRTAVEASANELVELHWLRPVKSTGMGRPTTTYLVNPRLFAPSGQVQKEQKSR